MLLDGLKSPKQRAMVAGKGGDQKLAERDDGKKYSEIVMEIADKKGKQAQSSGKKNFMKKSSCNL